MLAHFVASFNMASCLLISLPLLRSENRAKFVGATIKSESYYIAFKGILCFHFPFICQLQRGIALLP